VRFSLIRQLVGIIVLGASLLMLYWSGRPYGFRTHTIDLLQTELRLPDSQQELTDPLASAGQIILVWPSQIRLGDPAEVRLRFEPAVDAGLISPGQSNLFLESRLELMDLQHTPTGEISQAFSFDHPLVFLWNLRPLQTGLFEGKTWIHLRMIETNNGGETTRLLAAPSFKIQVQSILGFSGIQARLMGSLGVAIGLFLALDGILERIGKLFGKIKYRDSMN